MWLADLLLIHTLHLDWSSMQKRLCCSACKKIKSELKVTQNTFNKCLLNVSTNLLKWFQSVAHLLKWEVNKMGVFYKNEAHPTESSIFGLILVLGAVIQGSTGLDITYTILKLPFALNLQKLSAFNKCGVRWEEMRERLTDRTGVDGDVNCHRFYCIFWHRLFFSLLEFRFS